MRKRVTIALITIKGLETALREFTSGKLVSGGGICEACGKRLQGGETVFALAGEVEEIKEYLYCQGCRPDDGDLPKGVMSLEPAQAVDEVGLDERRMGFEVTEGSSCTHCGHYFEVDEWLFVGMVEGLSSGIVYCGDCYECEVEAEE
jgi:hypothetical protein